MKSKYTEVSEFFFLIIGIEELFYRDIQKR